MGRGRTSLLLYSLLNGSCACADGRFLAALEQCGLSAQELWRQLDAALPRATNRALSGNLKTAAASMPEQGAHACGISHLQDDATVLGKNKSCERTRSGYFVRYAQAAGLREADGGCPACKISKGIGAAGGRHTVAVVAPQMSNLI